MGQSVSISYGLLFLTTLLISSILYSTYLNMNENILIAEKNEFNIENIQMHTNIALINASLDTSSQKINIYIDNTGTEIIYSLDKMDIFTNATIGVDCGEYVYQTWIPCYSLGSSIITAGCYWNYSIVGDNTRNPDFWDPDERLNITIFFNVTIIEQFYSYTVSTPNGLSDSFIYNTTK